MIDFAYDDGGRRASGRKGEASDCVTRALAIVSNAPYEECYQEVAGWMAEHGYKRSARNRVPTKIFEKVFADYGLKKAKIVGPRPTLSEAYRLYGDCICRTSNHVMAIVDGVLRDLDDIRTYEWFGEVRERKAMAVYFLR